MKGKLTVGDKVWFKEEKQGYTVMAVGKRYAICTKPMNALKTVIYTIIDFKLKKRGAENLIFCVGFETVEQCKEAIKRLEKRKKIERTELSYRRSIDLNISQVKGYFSYENI